MNTKRTIREWLLLLPPPLREQAFDNIRHYASENLELFADSMEDAIRRGWPWYNSKEGGKYWEQVTMRARTGEFDPKPVPAPPVGYRWARKGEKLNGCYFKRYDGSITQTSETGLAREDYPTFVDDGEYHGYLIPLTPEPTQPAPLTLPDRLRYDQIRILHESWKTMPGTTFWEWAHTHAFMSALKAALALPAPKTPEQVQAEKDNEAFQRLYPGAQLGGRRHKVFIAGCKAAREGGAK